MCHQAVGFTTDFPVWLMCIHVFNMYLFDYCLLSLLVMVMLLTWLLEAKPVAFAVVLQRCSCASTRCLLLIFTGVGVNRRLTSSVRIHGNDSNVWPVVRDWNRVSLEGSCQSLLVQNRMLNRWHVASTPQTPIRVTIRSGQQNSGANLIRCQSQTQMREWSLGTGGGGIWAWVAAANVMAPATIPSANNP